MPNPTNNLLALDVGEQRIGVAIANEEVGFAHALTTLQNSPSVADEIAGIVAKNMVKTLVVGLPRGMEGQDTKQTEWVRTFAKQLEPIVSVPIAFQDEALTSHKAKTELAARGKSYEKGEVDALAATYILEDYIMEHPHRSAHV